MWERERWMERVRSQMPGERWAHTEGVMRCAVELARRFGADPEKAEMAALLHDYAKYWPIERQRAVIAEQRLGDDLLAYDPPLWHAPIAAWVAEREFGVTDPDVLNAIRYHTSGREHMSVLEKVVCLADYIEPGRRFPGVERIRELAAEDLERALLAGFDSTISFLLEQGNVIYPLTVMARNGLIREISVRGNRSEHPNLGNGG